MRTDPEPYIDARILPHQCLVDGKSGGQSRWQWLANVILILIIVFVIVKAVLIIAWSQCNNIIDDDLDDVVAQFVLRIAYKMMHVLLLSLVYNYILSLLKSLHHAYCISLSSNCNHNCSRPSHLLNGGDDVDVKLAYMSLVLTKLLLMAILVIINTLTTLPLDVSLSRRQARDDMKNRKGGDGIKGIIGLGWGWVILSQFNIAWPQCGR